MEVEEGSRLNYGAFVCCVCWMALLDMVIMVNKWCVGNKSAMRFTQAENAATAMAFQLTRFPYATGKPSWIVPAAVVLLWFGG